MLKKDLTKHNLITLQKDIDSFGDLPMNNALLKKYLKIDYQSVVKYLNVTEEFEVQGIINFAIKALDARTGEEFEYRNKIDWDEAYLLTDFPEDDINFDQLVGEQINANIPINLTHSRGTINKVGPGWELLSEDDFELNRSKTSDPRWDKLKQLNQKDK